MTKPRTADVIIVGASLSAAATAKRLVDAGYETIALERFSLPRTKPCSGIISPRGHRFLIENFGPLPKEVLHEPTSCKGVTFYFPGGVELPMEFDHGSTPHLDRTYADHWAMQRSGAEIHDNMRFLSATDQGTHVDIVAGNGQEERLYRARYLIGADGPNSKVVRTLYPEYRDAITWFTVKQHLHEIIDCPLDPAYFHYWFHPELGYYTWSHQRNGRQIVGVGHEANDDFAATPREGPAVSGRTSPRQARPVHHARNEREQLRAVTHQPLRLRQGKHHRDRPGSRVLEYDR